MSKVITPEVAQAAFDWLLRDNNQIALARGNLVRSEFAAKRAFASAFKRAMGSVDSRKMEATLDDEYAGAMERLAVAEGTWEAMKQEREKAITILEVWRTQEASERYLTQRFR